jgi:uncharacterized membrane protein
MNTFTKGAMLASAVAGMFACTTPKSATTSGAMATDSIHCGGINSCKGQGSCAGNDNACKSQNSCKGKGFVDTSAADCKAKGGTVLASKM